MPITWKSRKGLKPEVILKRIESIRTIGPENKPSFSGFELEDMLPALQSMLEFPDVAIQTERSTLTWKAVASISGELTKKSFLDAINKILSAQISTREEDFHVLTSLSIEAEKFPATIKIEDSTIRISGKDYPKKYSARYENIAAYRLPVPSVPKHYARVIVELRAKSPFEAMTKALRALDLLRALWNLRCNPQMEIVYNNWNPINKIRLGSIHTIHNKSGEIASDQVWFELNFAEATSFKPDHPEHLRKLTNASLKKLKNCTYSEALSSALLRYVRALDERDFTTALLHLWGAIESLTSPDIANYEQVVRRCSFIFRETEYHQQLLEHLRESRNQSIHTGDQCETARINCLQLQRYFYHLMFFHLGSTHFFKGLSEANEFLDLPRNADELKRKKEFASKALRFRS